MLLFVFLGKDRRTDCPGISRGKEAWWYVLITCLLSALVLMLGWQKIHLMLRAPRLGRGPKVVLRQGNPPPFFKGSEVPFRK